MRTSHHLRETTFRPSSDTFMPLSATGTFLDNLPFVFGNARGAAAAGVAEVGAIIQLLTLRTIDGARVLEPGLGIPVADGGAPAERFVLDGDILAAATRSTLMDAGPEGARLQRELFGQHDGEPPRIELTGLISLQRRWGAASNGMASAGPVSCRIKPGVVLLGAVRVSSPDARSLALLFSALDRAATRGLPSAEHGRGPCQLDVLSIVGGALDPLPSAAALVQSYESRFLLHPATACAAEPWPHARFRLDGRSARRAASQIARLSPLDRATDFTGGPALPAHTSEGACTA